MSFLPSDEDDTAELLRELQRIKQERAEEQARRVSRISCAELVCVLEDADLIVYRSVCCYSLHLPKLPVAL